MSIRTIIAAAGLAALMAGPALAAEDLFPPSAGSGASDGPFTLGGSLAATSEYFFRGLSQTDDAPAVQGAFNAAYKLSDAVSANAGIFASNVDFADASIEVDLTAGLSGEFMGVSWMAGGIYYAYPDSNNNSDDNEDFDFWELTGGLGYDFGLFSIGGSVNWTPSFQAGGGQTQDSGTGWYLNGNIKVPLKYVDLVAAVGRQYIEHNDRWGNPDWTDYKIALQAMVYGFALEAAFIDTTLDSKQYTAAADKQFLFTVSKSF